MFMKKFDKFMKYVDGERIIFQNLSPRILLASWRSFDMIVTLLAWIAHKLVSSNRETR